MKKLRIGLIACLACIALACCVAVTACKKSDEKQTYTVTWQPDDHVTLVAEGYDTLPTQLDEGTEVVFTATPESGYEIASVTPTTVKKDGSKYKFTVQKDITVTVTTAKGIESISVALNDENKVFYAGDTVEPDDITVSIKYKTNETDTVSTGYSIKYGTGSESNFVIGDSAFTVTYRGVASAPVELNLLDGEEGVVALVTIDTDGGTLTQAYLDKISSYAHYNYNAQTGIATFTHKGLEAAIALPALGTNNINGEATKGLEGDYILRGWNGSETLNSIPKNTVLSASYKLTSSPVLLNITKIYYEIKTVKEEAVPYLVVEGDFKLAESAYLYLYEGNKEVSLKGDTITKNPNNRSFKLEYDMRQLVDAGDEYKGSWMDIKFVTVVKEAESKDEEDETLTQEIILEDFADIEDFCDTTQMINVGEYDYGFKTYYNEGHTYLKAVFEDAAVYTFTLEAGTVKDGDNTLPALVMKGQIAAAQLDKYKGQNVKVDFNNGSWTAPIDQNGAWTLTIPLRVEGSQSIGYGSDGYAHFYIVDGDGTEHRGDKDGNLLNKCCVGGLSPVENRYGLSGVLTGNAIRIANEDNTQVFYVGEGQWGGLIATARNEKGMTIATTGAKLEAGTIGEEGEEQDVAFLVFTGIWIYFEDHTFNAETDLEVLMNAFTEYSIQSGSTWNYLDSAESNKGVNTVFIINEDGTFEIKLALTNAGNGEYYYLHYCHTGRTNGDFYTSDVTVDINQELTVGGQTFSFFDSSEGAPEGHDGWLQWRLIVHVSAAEQN